MAVPAYSKLLGEVPQTAAAGVFNFGPPPAGFIWVVRDIDAVNVSSALVAVSEVIVETSTGAVIWGIGSAYAVGSTPYQFRGRQVLPPGVGFSVHVLGPLWSVRVSGYELSA